MKMNKILFCVSLACFVTSVYALFFAATAFVLREFDVPFTTYTVIFTCLLPLIITASLLTVLINVTEEKEDD